MKNCFSFCRLLVGISVMFYSQPGMARECPSRLPSHMFQVLDSLELGAEFRGFYFGASVGEGMPSSNPEGVVDFQNNMMLGLKPSAAWYPLDGLTFSFEAEARFAKPGWEYKTPRGFDFRLTQAIAEYDPGDYRVTAGLQAFSFGTAALLDQRFVGLSGEYRTKLFNVSVFSGVTARKLMRSVSNCMWMRYASDNIGWKTVSPTIWNNMAAGVSTSFKAIRPFRLMALYLFSYPRELEGLQSHSLSVEFAGPIVKKYLSFVLDAIGYLDYGNRFLPGFVIELRARAGKKPWSPRFRLALASSFGESEDHRINSVYENLSWGIIRRYSLYNGHVAYIKAAWPMVEYVKPFVHYYVQSFKLSLDDFEDELDVGVDLSIGDLYRLRLAYVGINLASDRQASNAFYAELRIIIGE